MVGSVVVGNWSWEVPGRDTNFGLACLQYSDNSPDLVHIVIPLMIMVMVFGVVYHEGVVLVISRMFD